MKRTSRVGHFALLVCMLLAGLGAPVSLRAQSDSARLSYFYQEAFKHKQAGRHAAAYALFRHCLEIEPDAPEALFEVGLYRIFLQDEEGGLPLLSRAVELAPQNAWFKETLAMYYINNREAERAISVLESMAKQEPHRTDVLSQLVSLYAATGQHKDAIRALDRIELLEGVNDQLTLEKYRLRMEEKDEAGALGELERLVAENPDEWGYKVLVGNHHLRVDKPEEARKVYDEVQQNAPQNPTLQMAWLAYYDYLKEDSVYRHLRDSLLYGEDTDMSVRVGLVRDFVRVNGGEAEGKTRIRTMFDRILSQPQKRIEMLALYSAYLTAEEAPADTVAAVMKRILDVEPDNRAALFHLVRYYGSTRDVSALADVCRQGINHYPDQLIYYFFLGFAYYQDDRVDEALDALKNGERQINEESDLGVVADLYSMMGDMLYQKGRVEEAFAAYDSSLLYNEDNVSCLNNYAYYLSLRKENLERAEEMSYCTLRAEPNNRTYLDTYAWILFIQGKYEEARTYIDKAITPPADPKQAAEEVSGVLLEHAGDIYFMCGDATRALELWKQAKATGEASPLIDQKITQKKYVE